MAPISMYLLITVLSLAILHQQVLARECSIEGLPQGLVQNNGHVYTMTTTEQPLQLNLTCKCSLYGPQWQVQPLGEAGGPPLFHNQPVQCMNRTNSCTSHINFISPKNKSQDLFVYLTKTFIITQTTVLMCFSDITRETLVVSMLEKDDHKISAPVAPTTSSASQHIPTSVSVVSMATNTPLITTVTVTQHTISTLTIACSSSSNKVLTATPTIEDDRRPPAITDTIVDTLGPSTLALVPVVVILLIISMTLCGLLLCMRSQLRERKSREDFERRRDSNSSMLKASSIDRLIHKRHKQSDAMNPFWKESMAVTMAAENVFPTTHQLDTEQCTNDSSPNSTEV